MPLELAHLLPPTWRDWLKLWIKEDIPSFDYGGFVVGNKQETAQLLLKSRGVFSRKILMGERLALNIVTRASGIATMTQTIVNKVRKEGWKGHYAVLVGGGSTHRMDLSQMIMLKDNHIWSKGSITKTVNEAKTVGGFSTKIEVESCDAGADIIMLDNFLPDSSKFPNVIIECSGGIRSDSICSFAAPHVDVLSMGALTQGYSSLDLSLKIQHTKL
eukprot:GSMAST32.ASY1.ANO1.2574.1 assembled CDS